MKIINIILSSLLLLTLLAACTGGGGGRRIVGEQCPANYTPFELSKVNDNQKMLSLQAEDREIPEGIYNYDGATLYYQDNSGLRLRMEDAKQKDGTSFKSAITCTRNSRMPMTGSLAVEGVYKLQVDGAPDFKTVSEVGEFSIDEKDQKFASAVKQDPTKKVESPSEAYKNGATEYFMVATDGNETNYEIRSHGKDANGEYYLSIRLIRQKK